MVERHDKGSELQDLLDGRPASADADDRADVRSSGRGGGADEAVRRPSLLQRLVSSFASRTDDD